MIATERHAAPETGALGAEDDGGFHFGRRFGDGARAGGVEAEQPPAGGGDAVERAREVQPSLITLDVSYNFV